jgi:putative flippase GtrA
MTVLSASAANGWMRLRGELWRYAVCGAGATVVDYGVWWLLTSEAGWWTVAAQLVSRPAGGLVGFTGNRWWTWRHRREFSAGRQFTRFWIVWGVGYLLSAVALYLYSRGLPNDRLLSKVLADLSAGLIGFLLQRAFTFR